MRPFSSRQSAGSPASRGRGLKPPLAGVGTGRRQSPASRGRGLKHTSGLQYFQTGKSPASRGRGLKRAGRVTAHKEGDVARFARAWIETFYSGFRNSRPSVARFARAWIETINRFFLLVEHSVARFARAWIETNPLDKDIVSLLSPASRGRETTAEIIHYEQLKLLPSKYFGQQCRHPGKIIVSFREPLQGLAGVVVVAIRYVIVMRLGVIRAQAVKSSVARRGADHLSTAAEPGAV